MKPNKQLSYLFIRKIFKVTEGLLKIILLVIIIYLKLRGL